MNAPHTIAPGVYHGISNADYHGGPGLSKSGLDLIDRSPFHYIMRRHKAPTPAMELGTHAHCAILEPDRFAAEYVTAPDCGDRRTKAGKEAWQAFADAAEGKTIIDADTEQRLHMMRASVLSIPDVAEALAHGAAEVSAYWDAAGVLCKCRPDFVHDCGPSGVILLDLKTTQNASPDDFARSVAKYRYDVQAAWYSDGYALASGREVLAFVFVAVESEYPHAASAVMLDPDSIDAGRSKYRRNLATYRACMESGEWPAYGLGIQTIELPKWAKE